MRNCHSSGGRKGEGGEGERAAAGEETATSCVTPCDSGSAMEAAWSVGRRMESEHAAGRLASYSGPRTSMVASRADSREHSSTRVALSILVCCWFVSVFAHCESQRSAGLLDAAGGDAAARRHDRLAVSGSQLAPGAKQRLQPVSSLHCQEHGEEETLARQTIGGSVAPLRSRPAAAPSGGQQGRKERSRRRKEEQQTTAAVTAGQHQSTMMRRTSELVFVSVAASGKRGRRDRETGRKAEAAAARRRRVLTTA